MLREQAVGEQAREARAPGQAEGCGRPAEDAAQADGILMAPWWRELLPCSFPTSVGRQPKPSAEARTKEPVLHILSS